MGCAVAVVLTFAPQGKAIEAVCGTYGLKTILTPREKLVHIGLVADIPDKFILGSGEAEMQRDGQLHDTKVGAKMPTVFG